ETGSGRVLAFVDLRYGAPDHLGLHLVDLLVRSGRKEVMKHGSRPRLGPVLGT
ncbi:MAG: hypothetical protein RIQ41_585, partial [Candidatus Parcubacteria bacterium]